jgi:hypothetical protein
MFTIFSLWDAYAKAAAKRYAPRIRKEIAAR